MDVKINRTEIRRIQCERNFRRSRILLVPLLVFGVILHVMDSTGMDFFIFKGVDISVLYTSCYVLFVLGTIYGHVVHKMCEIKGKPYYGLKNILIVLSFCSFPLVDSYGYMNADNPFFAFILFACIMFIMITIFDVNRWIFLVFYTVVYLLIMREIEVLMGTEMMYVSAIYSGIMILLTYVLDKYSCANIEQMLILQKYNEKLEKEVEVKTKSLQNQLHKTELIQEKTLAGLADIIENRDSNTGEHTKHTQSIVRDMLSELKKLEDYKHIVSNGYEDRVVKAAPLHDIGKISISDVILNAPRKLTAEEFEIMKTHTTEGAKIVRKVLTGIEEEPYIDTAEDIVRYHHERWDGTGYPEGLTGAEIPLSARIMAIADVYDALTSERCYKPPYTKEAALEIMREGSGTQFDPTLLDIFLNKVAKQY